MSSRVLYHLDIMPGPHYAKTHFSVNSTAISIRTKLFAYRFCISIALQCCFSLSRCMIKINFQNKYAQKFGVIV
jgi:hypothetical protein